MVRHVARVRVRYAETDQMGVAYYGRYFEFFEQARSDMLRTLGLPYAELEKAGTFLPVLEAHAVYHRSATYDDLLEIETIIREKPTARIRIEYIVRKEESPEVLVEGYTVHIFLNRTTRKPTRIPAPLAHLLEHAFSQEHPHAE